MDINRKYIDKREVAAITGLSVSTLNRWVFLKIHIPFIKAGGRILFEKSDINDFMSKNKVAVN